MLLVQVAGLLVLRVTPTPLRQATEAAVGVVMLLVQVGQVALAVRLVAEAAVVEVERTPEAPVALVASENCAFGPCNMVWSIS